MPNFNLHPVFLLVDLHHHWCLCVSLYVSADGSQGHYTRAQANSPRPVMNSSGSATKQGSQAQQQQSQHAQQQVSQQHQQQLQSSPGQQRGSRSTRRKGSDSSIPDDEKIKEEKMDSGSGRGGNLKLHCTVLYCHWSSCSQNTPFTDSLTLYYPAVIQTGIV